MAFTCIQHDIYGGAMTVDLPTDLVDASNLRQIPDHQEVFLREHTLTSIIFEINEFQTSDHLSAELPALPVNPSQDNTDTDTDNVNISAATHHLIDTVQPPDYVAEGSMRTVSVTLTKPSIAAFTSHCTSASVITPEIDYRAAAHQATLPVAWQSNPVQKEFETKTLQLLIRMHEYEVDFCVRINVPMKEFLEDGTQAGNEEETRAIVGSTGQAELQWAERVMDTIVRTLDVKDFALFGGDA